MSMIPTPEELLEMAQDETPEFELEEYWQTIIALRKQKKSWRDIATWLGSHGLVIDHSSVYRYAKGTNAVLLAYLSKKKFEMEVSDFLSERENEIEDTDEFSSAAVETNCDVFEITDFEDFTRDLKDDSLIVEASFMGYGEQIDERPYSGNKVAGRATITFSPDGSYEMDVSAARHDDPSDFDH